MSSSDHSIIKKLAWLYMHDQPEMNTLPGGSRIETLPTELLEHIVSYCSKEYNSFASYDFRREPKLSQFGVDRSNKYSRKAEQIDSDDGLIHCLLTSRILYSTALKYQYGHVRLYRTKNFQLFVRTIMKTSRLGLHVRSLELFLPTADLVDTRSLCDYMKTWVSYMPALSQLQLEFQEDIDRDINSWLYQTTRAWLVQLFRPVFPQITHLRIRLPNRERDKEPESLIASEFFSPWNGEDFLSDIRSIRALDLLWLPFRLKEMGSLSDVARLQVFSVRIKDIDMLDHLTTALKSHPALKDSLTHFCLHTWEGDEDTPIVKVFENMPYSVRSLDLSSWNFSTEYVPHLQRLCMSLEELRIGTGLTVQDLEGIVINPGWAFDPVPDIFIRQEPPVLDPSAPMEVVRLAAWRAKLMKRIHSATWVGGEKEPLRKRVYPLRLLGFKCFSDGLMYLGQSILLAKNITNLEIIEIADRDYWDPLSVRRSPDEELYRAAGWGLGCSILDYTQWVARI